MVIAEEEGRRGAKRLRRRARGVGTPVGLAALAALVAVYSGLAGGSLSVADAQGPPSEVTQGRKVVLFLLDGVSLKDLVESDAPNVHRLMNRGGLGLMNVRTAAGISQGNCYLSLGAGARADAGPDGRLSFDAGRRLGGQWGRLTAGELWRERARGTLADTNVAAPAQGTVNISIADVWAQSESHPLDAIPGYLGSVLADAGIRPAVVGNADTLDELHREAAMVAMASDGRVPVGTVASNLTARADILGSRRSKPRLTVKEARAALSRTDFVVVELGDTARVNLQSAQASEASALLSRRKAIRWSDELVGSISALTDPDRTLVMVATPSPETTLVKDRWVLTPLIVAGPGVSPGALISDTTRRRGVVTNMDVAPTVLGFLGLGTPPLMTGRPVASVSQRDTVGYLLDLEDTAVTGNQWRNTIIGVEVALSLVALALGLVSLLFSRDRPLYPDGVSRGALLFVVALPLAMLFQWPMRQGSWPWTVLAVVGLAVAMTAMLMRLKPLVAIAVLSLATAGALALDTVLGGPLQSLSVHGTDIVAGGRFYGMGNTYMGVTIAALISGLSALLDLTEWPSRSTRLVLIGLFAACAVIVGAPSLGANVGGLITAAGAGAIAFVVLAGRRPTWKTAVSVTVAVVVSVLVLLAVDMALPGRQTHAARAVVTIEAGGPGEIVNMVARKLEIQMTFLSGSRTLVAVLIGGMVALMALLARPGKELTEFAARHPHFERGIFGIACSAVIAMVFNDTGIVAAAIIMLYAVGPLMYVMLTERRGAGSVGGQDAAPGTG